MPKTNAVKTNPISLFEKMESWANKHPTAIKVAKIALFVLGAAMVAGLPASLSSLAVIPFAGSVDLALVSYTVAAGIASAVIGLSAMMLSVTWIILDGRALPRE